MVFQFYDFDFNLLHIETKAINITWDIKYNDIGTLQVTMPLNNKILDIIIKNKYLVLCYKNFSAIIIVADVQDQIILYGRTCNWILTKRITKKFDTVTDTAINIARSCASNAFSDVSNFKLGKLVNIAKTIDYSISDNKITSDVIIDCLKQENCGHYVNFDYKNKKWIFNTSVSKEIPLIISESNKNAYGVKWTQDILDMSNCGYYNKVTVTGNDSESSTPVFTYISKNDTPSGIYRWESILNGETENEALNDLNNHRAITDMSSSTKKIRYGIDYNLGDIVNIQIVKNDFKKAVKRRINGIKIVFEKGNHTEQPTFEEV